MQSHFDIVVVGAGAAGLAAARVLAGAPVEFLVLEARPRTGGRGHTVFAGDYPVDLGCGWLHSADRNLFAGAAASLGFELDRTDPPWMRQAFNVEFSAAERAAFGKALEDLEARIEEAAARGEDRPVGDLMDPASPWNAGLNAFSSYYNGAAFADISTTDYAAYDDTDVNWRAPEGYGALIGAYGAGAPVMLGTPVRRIDHGGAQIRIETSAGTLTARAVIITAPTPLIADGRLAFTPDLPDLREAASALPLGLANKVLLALEQPEAFPVDSHLFGNPGRSETGSYHLRPFGRPMIEVFLGGAHARLLESEGEGSARAFAIEEIVSLLGSDMRSRLTPIVETAWAAEPFTGGSYSYALPGRAHLRAAFGRTIERRIFIAGEAASRRAFSTAHGAAETGIAAANAALTALNAAV